MHAWLTCAVAAASAHECARTPETNPCAQSWRLAMDRPWPRPTPPLPPRPPRCWPRCVCRPRRVCRPPVASTQHGVSRCAAAASRRDFGQTAWHGSAACRKTLPSITCHRMHGAAACHATPRHAITCMAPRHATRRRGSLHDITCELLNDARGITCEPPRDKHDAPQAPHHATPRMGRPWSMLAEPDAWTCMDAWRPHGRRAAWRHPCACATRRTAGPPAPCATMHSAPCAALLCGASTVADAAGMRGGGDRSACMSNALRRGGEGDGRSPR
eukprot:366211-Chlamydomonas_euryale.AAC.2